MRKAVVIVLVFILGAALAVEVAPLLQGVGDAPSFRCLRALGRLTEENTVNEPYYIHVAQSSGPVGTPIEVSYVVEDVEHTWIGVFLNPAHTTAVFSTLTEVNGTLTFDTKALSPGQYNIYIVHYGFVQAVTKYLVLDGNGLRKARATTITTTADTITVTTTTTATGQTTSSTTTSGQNSYSTSTSTTSMSTSTTSSTSSSSSSSGSSTSASGTSGSTGTSACPTPARRGIPSGWLRDHNNKRNDADSGLWLQEHNKRRDGIVPPLEWNVKLASSAQAWADVMAASCDLEASGIHGVGENIAYGFSSIPEVMAEWADQEKANYDPETGTCSGPCGHYTQVMWKMTRMVGCATAFCKGTPYYVCHYVRPGNCNGNDFTTDQSLCEYYFV